MIIKGYVFSILYAALCVLGALLLYKFGVPKKYTRKFVHILVGFEWVILYVFMGAGSPHFLAVCLICFLVLAAEYKLKFVPAMSSDSDNAPGTVYYAVAMSIMATVTLFIPDMIYAFGVGVFCTSFGDGLAGVVGQAITKHNPKIYGTKSLLGTVTNFLVCFAVPFVFDIIFDMNLAVWECILIALFAVEIELFCGFGLDNIVLTLGSAALTYAFSYQPLINNYIVPIILTPLIIAVAYKKQALTLGGIFAAIFLDIVISVSLGNLGFLTLFVFFACSIIVDKFKKWYKKTKQNDETSHEKRGECRDSVQVFSNGLVAGICAILYLNTHEKMFLLAFAASLAEAFADTVASGIGVAAKRVFDPFRFEKCEHGISGGMSLVGTVSSFIASFVVALIPFAFGAISPVEMIVVAVAGFLGAIFDSFLGSVFQIKFKCSICSRIIEKEEHCGAKSTKYRGFAVINNDVVNFLSTVFAAVVAAAIFALI